MPRVQLREVRYAYHCAWLTVAAIAAAGTVVVSGTAVAQKRRISYVCMTDDGYGRKLPCSMAYKAANPNWRRGDNCFTNDGYGRKLPCSMAYKAMQQKPAY